MGVSVGAEYIIANALIALNKKGIKQIKMSALQNFGIEVQKICIEQSVDAVFLYSKNNVSAAIYDYSDYFDYFDDDKDPLIRIKNSANIEDIEDRFIGFLPLAVLRIMMKYANELEAA